MYKPKGYIFLKQASKLSGCSQEYLSLRARQGKLRAVKLGRSWATKKEWLKEYLTKNPKTQIPKSKQIPNSKFQIKNSNFSGFRYTLKYSLVVVLIFFFLSFLIPFSLMFSQDALDPIKNSFQVISKEIIIEIENNKDEFTRILASMGNSIEQISLPAIELPKIALSDWQPEAHKISYLIGKEIVEQKDKTFLLLAESQNNLKETIDVFQEFGKWYQGQVSALIPKIPRLKINIEVVY